MIHLGAWHSHHHLKLYRPSAGDDESTKRQLQVEGINDFLQIIVNLDNKTADSDIRANAFYYQKNASTGGVLMNELQIEPFDKVRWNATKLSKKEHYAYIEDVKLVYKICSVKMEDKWEKDIDLYMKSMSRKTFEIFREEVQKMDSDRSYSRKAQYIKDIVLKS